MHVGILVSRPTPLTPLMVKHIKNPEHLSKLPTTSRAPAESSNWNTGMPHVSVSSHRILVIGCDPIQRMILRRVGQGAGFIVDEASSVDEVCTKLFDYEYDLMTVDLPLGPGQEDALWASLADAGCRCPLLVISRADDGNRSAAKNLAERWGLLVCDAYSKPIDVGFMKECFGGIFSRLAIGIPACGGCGWLHDGRPHRAKELSDPVSGSRPP